MEHVLMEERSAGERLGRGLLGCEHAPGGLSSGCGGGVVGAETRHIKGVKSTEWGKSGLRCWVFHLLRQGHRGGSWAGGG